MNVVVIGHFLYPSGSASASRVRCISRGLVDAGARVRVIPLIPLRGADDQDTHNGWFASNGVEYYPAGGRTNSGSGWSSGLKRSGLLRRMREAVAVAARVIDELLDAGELDVLIGYTQWYFPANRLFHRYQKQRVLIVREVNELPSTRRFPGGMLHPVFWNHWLNHCFSVPRANGVIAISSLLEQHFEHRDTPVVRVPALIDTVDACRENEPLAQRQTDSKRLVCVSACRDRDAPRTLLDAVRRLISTQHDVRLDIIGNDQRRRSVRRLTASTERDPILRERVRFLGWIPDEELQGALRNADVLLLPRRAGHSSDASFPTRLPELLMSGNPVIASDVGDLRDYLTNGEDIVLVKPDSSEALAASITRLLALRDSGRSIGERGKARCVACFDARDHGKRIVRFLDDLLKRRAMNRTERQTT